MLISKTGNKKTEEVISFFLEEVKMENPVKEEKLLLYVIRFTVFFLMVIGLLFVGSSFVMVIFYEMYLTASLILYFPAKIFSTVFRVFCVFTDVVVVPEGENSHTENPKN